jgi:hypothetical protein
MIAILKNIVGYIFFKMSQYRKFDASYFAAVASDILSIIDLFSIGFRIGSCNSNHPLYVSTNTLMRKIMTYKQFYVCMEGRCSVVVRKRDTFEIYDKFWFLDYVNDICLTHDFLNFAVLLQNDAKQCRICDENRITECVNSWIQMSKLYEETIYASKLYNYVFQLDILKDGGLVLHKGNGECLLKEINDYTWDRETLNYFILDFDGNIVHLASRRPPVINICRFESRTFELFLELPHDQYFNSICIDQQGSIVLTSSVMRENICKIKTHGC